MAELNHRTREGSSTYGKPRVYVSFFGKSGPEVVSGICDDILGISNCALFMYPDGCIPEDPEALETELGLMQLFVLVCTKEYLSDANCSRDREILFALEHGIPVLPVIPAEDVIDGFNALCERLGIGSLHCLDRNVFAGDDSGYRNKLKEYLDYFLISAEDTGRIREQFRACIFLSYRKKDKEYARELIRRIHRLDKYYDVAVWYDDYLVPGRSFEDEIFGAMDRSDLFILAVTPNIYARNAGNEDNYVVRKEYPEALKRGKKIVAAELQKTDRASLLIRFEKLPECVSAYDELALSGALADLDGFEKPDNPARRYYLGLAYLNGLNTEVDPDRAFRLISSAAAEGMEEAMDRMVRMYRSGIAIKRDYALAIEWQGKLVCLAEKRLEAQGSAENAHLLAYRLEQLGNYLTETGDTAGAEKAFTRTLDMLEQYTGEAPSAGLIRDLSVICNKLGDLYLSGKDYIKAAECFARGRRSAAILKDLRLDEVSVRDYAVSSQKLGEVCRLQGKLNEAEQYYAEAFRILRETADKEPTAGNLRDVYITGGMLGDIYMGLCDFTKAEEYYRNSLKLRETVDGETGAAWARRDISVIWEKLADLYDCQGRMREASDAYEQAVYTADELAEKTCLPVHETELAKICTKAGEFHLAHGNYDDAAYYLEAGLAIDEKRQRSTASAEDKRNLSVSCNRLAMMYRETGNSEKAKEYFLKDYMIAKELAGSSGTPEARRDLGLSCNYLGGICADLEQYAEAQEYYTEGIRNVDGLVRETDDPVHWDDLAVLYFNLFRMTRNRGAFGQAYEIWKKLSTEHTENGIYRERYELLKRLAGS